MCNLPSPLFSLPSSRRQLEYTQESLLQFKSEREARETAERQAATGVGEGFGGFGGFGGGGGGKEEGKKEKEGDEERKEKEATRVEKVGAMVVYTWLGCMLFASFPYV